MFHVFDNTGLHLFQGNTYESAVEYCNVKGRPDWRITEVVFIPTQKQRNAIKFIELMMLIPFEGNINCYADVNAFLDNYLPVAKKMYVEMKNLNSNL